MQEMAVLMRQDPGFKVNMVQDGKRRTFLHLACWEESRSAVIPLLLAHPDIDVNLKDYEGQTPFMFASGGYVSCVREMLKDSMVKVNEPDNDGYTPLFWAAYYGNLDIIMWWIASGREIDLGKPWDVYKTDAIGAAKMWANTEVVNLLDRFKENPEEARLVMRVELGCTTRLRPRCSPWSSLSLMSYCKSTTPRPPHPQPGSSLLPKDSLLNSRWCFATVRWDQARRSSQARRARWPSSPWPRVFCGPHSSPTSTTLSSRRRIKAIVWGQSHL